MERIAGESVRNCPDDNTPHRGTVMTTQFSARLYVRLDFRSVSVRKVFSETTFEVPALAHER